MNKPRFRQVSTELRHAYEQGEDLALRNKIGAASGSLIGAYAGAGLSLGVYAMGNYPIPSGYPALDALAGLTTATFALYFAACGATRERDFELARSCMENPRITDRYVKAHKQCTGRTNAGCDVAILISDWTANETQKDRDQFWDEGWRIQRHLSGKKTFLGHPIDKVHLTGQARSVDLYDAICNSSVSSIVLVGHSSVGAWHASDRRVTSKDVEEWVEYEGHCKNGFGLKTGCNIMQNGADVYQVLSPAYSHPNHKGNMYIVAGFPDTNPEAHEGSELTRGLGTSPYLVRLRPEI